MSSVCGSKSLRFPHTAPAGELTFKKKTAPAVRYNIQNKLEINLKFRNLTLEKSHQPLHLNLTKQIQKVAGVK